MLDRNESVARIVLDHSECAAVFQKHRIDFCCKGQMSLADACADRGVDPALVLADLEHTVATRQGKAEADPRELSTAALVGHIVSRHHEYLRRVLPFLGPRTQKVARVHGDHNPKLRDVDAAFRELSEALLPHLDQEEEVLFPALMSRNGDRAVIAAELASMHADHLAVGAILQRLRTAADEFRTPDWACNSYRTSFAELEALEADILRHVHLENHVLMPRFAAS
mgnify:CR=1 FL=1